MEECGDVCKFLNAEEEGAMQTACKCTLSITGIGVNFTGITLAVGVATWIFSPLKFQADMGILLTFMFLVNMLGAIFLLPALGCWLWLGMGPSKLKPIPVGAALVAACNSRQGQALPLPLAVLSNHFESPRYT